MLLVFLLYYKALHVQTFIVVACEICSHREAASSGTIYFQRLDSERSYVTAAMSSPETCIGKLNQCPMSKLFRKWSWKI